MHAADAHRIGFTDREDADASSWRALWRVGVLALCLGLALVALAAPAWAAKDDLDLVSRAAGATGDKGNGQSYGAMSANGRFVAFASDSTNLHTDDDDTNWDVFVRDLETDTVTLVSRADGATGDKGNWHSENPSISADGRFVAFTSFASNLHPDDDDRPVIDVYVRDLQENTTTLVSRADGASGETGNGHSGWPAISDDGRSVAFTSFARNLHLDDQEAIRDVFVRDLDANTTTLVSRADGATGAKGNGYSDEPAISDDGRFVAFSSEASNLPADGDTADDVFVRDLEEGTTKLVSRAAGPSGDNGNGPSDEPAISDDGRFVAFSSSASNIHPENGDANWEVFVRDMHENTNTLVSRADGATGDKGNDYSVEPSISADGRFVAFSSWASNLRQPDDTDTGEDVFVRDLEANSTTLVSRAAGATGTDGNDESYSPTISADGRFVAFTSWASNLHPVDEDTDDDVFRRDVLGAPPEPPLPAEPPAAEPPAAQQPAAPPPVAHAVSAQPGCPYAGSVITGTDDDDDRAGGALSDIILGLLGDDRLRGLAGADCLYGQGGADRLLAASGHDRVFGGAGADRLAGGAGHDRLVGGRGPDRIAAGPGNDRVRARGLALDTIDCGPGRRDVAIVDRRDDTRRCEQVRLP
jgi:Tol biopolymer transport system component